MAPGFEQGRRPTDRVFRPKTGQSGESGIDLQDHTLRVGDEHPVLRFEGDGRDSQFFFCPFAQSYIRQGDAQRLFAVGGLRGQAVETGDKEGAVAAFEHHFTGLSATLSERMQKMSMPSVPVLGHDKERKTTVA